MKLSDQFFLILRILQSFHVDQVRFAAHRGFHEKILIVSG